MEDENTNLNPSLTDMALSLKQVITDRLRESNPQETIKPNESHAQLKIHKLDYSFRSYQVIVMYMKSFVDYMREQVSQLQNAQNVYNVLASFSEQLTQRYVLELFVQIDFVTKKDFDDFDYRQIMTGFMKVSTIHQANKANYNWSHVGEQTVVCFRPLVSSNKATSNIIHTFVYNHFQREINCLKNATQFQAQMKQLTLLSRFLEQKLLDIESTEKKDAALHENLQRMRVEKYMSQPEGIYGLVQDSLDLETKQRRTTIPFDTSMINYWNVFSLKELDCLRKLKIKKIIIEPVIVKHTNNIATLSENSLCKILNKTPLEVKICYSRTTC